MKLLTFYIICYPWNIDKVELFKNIYFIFSFTYITKIWYILFHISQIFILLMGLYVLAGNWYGGVLSRRVLSGSICPGGYMSTGVYVLILNLIAPPTRLVFGNKFRTCLAQATQEPLTNIVRASCDGLTEPCGTVHSRTEPYHAARQLHCPNTRVVRSTCR